MANGQNTAAIAGRLAEPSTWAGLAIFGQGVAMAAADWKNGAAWGNIFAGLAAVFVREKGGAGA
ncbi:MAG TPA: hypothetical protein VJ673_02685 [Aromatoleum sp.]|uniref:hypothetical protein n=1 Tax=Aromatoleum sp. TaxID=2307007 RepID=UPI002B49EF81|nr:hypothetical protein [Aromatoleum sp.]HJV24559.1 hypothetical protein [Aromatoleum sp.]